MVRILLFSICFMVANRINFLAMGIIPSPRDCYQVIRGLKTLPLRMRKHMENSLLIGKFLESQSQVEKVLHPGN